MISVSVCLQRRATDQLGPLESARPMRSYTTSRDIISFGEQANFKPRTFQGSRSDDAIRVPALDLLRNLIDRVVVHHDAGTKGITLEVEGALSAMIAQAQPGGLGDVDPSSVKLVAGVGFEPTTFRL